MTFDDMLKYVLPHTPGCGSALAIEKLRLAAIEFFERTGAWEVTLTNTSVANQANYTLAGVPAGAMVHDLVSVRIATEFCEYPIRSEDDATDMIAAYDLERLAYTPDRAVVYLNPAPTVATKTIRTKVMLKPTLAATDIPDALANHHADVIGCGAVGLLHAMEGEPWAKASNKAAYFNDRIQAIAHKAATGFTRGPLRVRPL